MMYTLYGIPSCDSVKKARRWLEQHAKAYQFHDYRVDGCTPELLTRFATSVGWEALLNQRSTSWRQLSDAQKADLSHDKALALMLAIPTLIKRPILDTGNGVLVGFDPAVYAAKL